MKTSEFRKHKSIVTLHLGWSEFYDQNNVVWKSKESSFGRSIAYTEENFESKMSITVIEKHCTASSMMKAVKYNQSAITLWSSAITLWSSAVAGTQCWYLVVCWILSNGCSQVNLGELEVDVAKPMYNFYLPPFHFVYESIEQL